MPVRKQYRVLAHSDLSSPSPLPQPLRHRSLLEPLQAGVSTILINAASSFGSPSWVVQKLFMSAQPSALVPSTLSMDVAPLPGPAPGVGIPGCCGGARCVWYPCCCSCTPWPFRPQPDTYSFLSLSLYLLFTASFQRTHTYERVPVHPALVKRTLSR